MIRNLALLAILLAGTLLFALPTARAADATDVCPFQSPTGDEVCVYKSNIDGEGGFCVVWQASPRFNAYHCYLAVHNPANVVH